MKELLDCVENYLETKSEHDNARLRYAGYSWDYHGRPWIDSMIKARRELETSLEAYIDRRVDAKLLKALE